MGHRVVVQKERGRSTLDPSKQSHVELWRLGTAHRTTILYSIFSQLTGRRVKDSIREKEPQKASNRQCSHLKHSCGCVSLANQT
jgi:hypothetical protein